MLSDAHFVYATREIYCSDATWADLCDQIEKPTAKDNARRQLAAVQ